MKKIILLIAVSLSLAACGSTDTPSQENKDRSPKPSSSRSNANTSKQLNLTILLDLSNRIDTIANPSQPQHYERDIILINHLTNYFIREMESKGGHMAKGKMKVIFQPVPSDSDINTAAEKLKIDLSPMTTAEKKKVHDELRSNVSENIRHIYSIPLRQSKWPGSDIWRFFKNDAGDMAIDNDTAYRNVLVILTDGYLFHEDSRYKEGNRFSYLTSDLLSSYNLRTANAEKRIQQLDFGLISNRSDLQNLEVLVLEITPSAGHKNDEDIIRLVLDKWFKEMQVRRWEIFNSDLPTNTKPKIDRFLNN